MMETQRLIAFVVFSFSALLLWDAWQKHNAPKVPVAPATTSVPAGVPQPTTPLAAGTPAPTPGVPAPPAGQAPAPAGEAVSVKTDLLDVELNTAGGDIRRVTFLRVFSATDRSKPLTLIEPNAKHYFVTQSGLLGEGLPNHKAVYQADARAYALQPGQDSIEVSLKARDAAGAEVVKRFRFRRGSYQIDVSYEIANRGDKPLSPFAYFQFLRDANPPSEEAAQTNAFAGVTTFTGPAVYTEESKFVKVDFADIAKGKQTHPKKAREGWIAMIQHYFVSAWLPKAGVEREYFTSTVGDTLYSAGVVVPVGAIAPGASGTLEVPVYIGPQETEKLEKVAPGLNLVVDYGWLYIIAPVRVCNNYLVDQQESAGWWMVKLAVLLFVCWLGTFFVGGDPVPGERGTADPDGNQSRSKLA